MVVTFGENDSYSGRAWKMTIDLSILCSLEGKKYDKTLVDVGALIYPTPRVRKLFKHMICSMGECELDAVEDYLLSHTLKWGKVFK